MNEKEKIIIANFKMNLTANHELNHWLSEFIKYKKRKRPQRTKIVLCPSIIQLDIFLKKIKAQWIEYGAQDCFWDKKGSFTGAISPVAIKSLGGQYVILGHSERRKYFGENNQVISLKINSAIKAGLKPILCLGENAQEKSSGQTLKVITRQLKECLVGVGPGKLEKIVFCYEPIWAISSNGPNQLPTVDDIMEARLLIKRILTNEFNRALAERVKIIYGGSVSEKNIQQICLEAGVDGVLVGKASLSPYQLIRMMELIDKN